MRTEPGWHGYWQNPGDAGLPMERRVAAAGRLRGRAAALSGADAADDRRADELRLRARLCGAGPAEGAGRRERARSRSAPARAGSPAPTRSACPSSGEFALDLPVGDGGDRRDARFDEWRRALPRPLVSSGAVRSWPATGCASRSRCRASVAVGEPYVFPVTRRRRSIMPRRSASAATATRWSPSSSGKRGEPGANSPACWRSATGAGSSSRAVPGAVPDGGTPIGELGARRHAAARCSARLPAASCST